MENHRALPIGGLMLILAGLGFVAGNLTGYPVWMLLRYVGPVLVIAVGCYFFYRLYLATDRTAPRGLFPWPLFPVLAGISGLAALLGYWQFSALYTGPIAMLIVGGWLYFRTARS